MSSNGKRSLRGIGSVGSSSKDNLSTRSTANMNGGNSSGCGSDTNSLKTNINADKNNFSSSRRRKDASINSLKNESVAKLVNDESKSRPRVHAQRKFAQGQGQSPSNSIQGSPAKTTSAVANSSSQQSSRVLDIQHRGTSTMHASSGSRSGNHSSSSSTASGPVTNSTRSNGKALDTLKKGERPKTEDFLTFLCLRGTSLLPPELDFFNQAPLPNTTNENSSDDDSMEDASSSYQQNANGSKPSGVILDNSRLQSTIGGVRKSASNTSTTSRNRALASAVKKTTSPRKDLSNSTPEKKLPESVQALKKKYTEQRLARSVLSKSLQPASRRTRSQTNEISPKENMKNRKRILDKSGREQARGKESSRSSTRASMTIDRKQTESRSLRNTKVDDARKSERLKVVAKTIPTRKPSAAAIVAKRKTRMATLTTAASRRVSRMLSRLTPRGTSSAKFVKSTLRKTLPLERQRSLRGRDISLSSEEEEEVNDDDDDSDDEKNGDKDGQKSNLKASKNDMKSGAHKANTKNKQRTNMAMNKRKGEDSDDEDADEETSSRESSRRPSKQDIETSTSSPVNKRQKKEYAGDMKKKKDVISKSSLNSDAKSKREKRSFSRDSNCSKDSNRSERPSRKTKEAATVYLNVLGQKLLSNKKEDDTISIESFSETAQEKRLEELGLETDKNKREANEDADFDSETSRCDSNKKKSNGKQQKIQDANKDKKKSIKNSLKELQDRLLQEAKNKIASTPGSPATLLSNSEGVISASITKNDSDTGDSDERITISQRTGYIHVKPRRSTEVQDSQSNQLLHSSDTKNTFSSLGTTSSTATQLRQQAALLESVSRRLSSDGRTKTPPRKILPKTSETSNDSKPSVSNSSSNSVRPHLPVGVVGAALSSSRISTPGVNVNQAKISSGSMDAASTMPVLPVIAGSMHGITSQGSPSAHQTADPASPLTQPLMINTGLPGNVGASKIINQTFNMAPLNTTTTSNPIPSTVQIATPSIIMSSNGMRMPIQIAPNQVPLQIRSTITSTTSSTIPTGAVAPIQAVPIMMPSGQIALPTIIQPVAPTTSSVLDSNSDQTIPPTATQKNPQQKDKSRTSHPKPLTTPSSSIAPMSSVSNHEANLNNKKPTIKVKHQQSNSTANANLSENELPASKNISGILPSPSVPPFTPTTNAKLTSLTDVNTVNKQPLVSPGPPELSPQQPKQKKQQPSQDSVVMKKSTPKSSESQCHNIPTAVSTQPPPILTPSGLPITSGAVIRSVAPKQHSMPPHHTKSNSKANTLISTSSSVRPTLPLPALVAGNVSSQCPRLQAPNSSSQTQPMTSGNQQNMQSAAMHMPNQPFLQHGSNQNLMSQHLSQPMQYLQAQYPNTTQGVMIQPMPNSSYSGQHMQTSQQPIQYVYPNYPYSQMTPVSQQQQQVSSPSNVQQRSQLPRHLIHPSQSIPELEPNLTQSHNKTTMQASPDNVLYSPQEKYIDAIPSQQPKSQASLNSLRKQSKNLNVHTDEQHVIPLQSTQPIRRHDQMLDSGASTIKQEKTKSSSISNISNPNKHASMTTSSSFRVDNESSPYAFEADPLEIKPQLSSSYRRPSGSQIPSEHMPRNKSHLDKASHHRKSEGSKSKKEHQSHSKSHTKPNTKSQNSIARDKLLKSLPTTVEVPDLGSSIPIPDELAAQLAEQAAAEGPKGNQETTYFIPLQSSSGQSFGVAVKLGTEGPPGPDQKVIMKAKLVTQPTGKPVGARVIGSQSSSKSPERAKDVEKTSPTAKKRHKRLSESSPRQKNSKSKVVTKTKSAYHNTSSSSSSSSADESNSDGDSSSSESSDDDVHANTKEKAKKKKKELSRMKSKPRDGMSKGNIKEEPGLDMSPNHTNSENKYHQEPTSCTTCLGRLEALDHFPKLGQQAHLIEAPVYKPTEKEFKDPMKYIERIRKEAQAFGMCKIIPPSSFKPELNVNDDMRFTAYNQYVNRLMNRWGPNSREMAAIKKYLDTQNVTIKANNHPLVSGVEIDLPALYHAVQDFGGLTEVIQRKKWNKIADFLRIPKGTQDRGNKLDDIYCKYLLPYDTLSPVEREELLRLVDEEWKERKKAKLRRLKKEDKLKSGSDEEDEDEEEDDDSEMEDEDDDECTLKGKSTSLAAFFRVARNLMAFIFKNPNNPVGPNLGAGIGGTSNVPGVVVDEEPPHVNEMEEEFWRLVMERDSHVQVQQGSIDTGTGVDGFGFPTSRGSSCGRHPWNLKILSNNVRSLLRCMGAVMGVTVPTLHVGMLFTTGCWYRDPHGLPWIEYNHTGAPKVWYGVPESHSLAFYTAMKLLVPLYCHRKKIWLPSDTVMVPPNVLVKHGVSVCRSVQEPGQFIVVFPRCYTSSFNTGYSIAESVYFATRDYLNFAEVEFENIRDSNEPMLFPLSKLLLSIAKDEKSRKGTLRKVKPYLESIRDHEYIKRTMISDLGVKQSERITLKTKKQEEDDEYECETCSANLYVSFLCDIKEDAYFCPEHALQYLQERKMAQRRNCKLYYTHSKEEISAIIKNVNQRLEDSDEDDSSSDDEMTRPPCKRVSEMGKMEWTPKPKDHLLPLHGHLEVKNASSTTTPHRIPTSSKYQRQQSPISEPTSPTSSRLSGPNVPPGTSVNVSSFSLIQHAKGKKLAASQEKSPKNKKSPEYVKKSNKKSPVVQSKSTNKKESQTSPKISKKRKKEEVELVGKNHKSKKVSSSKVDSKKDGRSSKAKSDTSKKKKPAEDWESDGQASESESNEEDSEKVDESSDESCSSPQAKKSKKAPVKSAKGKKQSPPAKQKKKETAPEKRRTSRRPTKKRKATLNKSGNLTSEILDMLLSTSNDESEDDDVGEDSSDESWK